MQRHQFPYNPFPPNTAMPQFSGLIVAPLCQVKVNRAAVTPSQRINPHKQASAG
jgi:hypothetical protein